MNRNKGFTLIELLVVIAIIGILSSVVLASLNTARDKGSDAAGKADVNQARVAAEVVFDTLQGSYGTLAYTAACGAVAVATPATHIFNDVSMQAQIDDAIVKNGGTEAKCQASGGSYFLSVPLKTGTAWCVDSTGKSKLITAAQHTALASGSMCP